MTLMYILDNKPLRLDVPFQHGDIVYPPNWLRLSSQADKEALGIKWVDDQPRPDDRFWWVTDNNDGTFSKTPKDLAQLKEQWVRSLKASAHSILSQYDWMVLREVEDPGTMPQDIKDYRRDVREYSGAAEADLNNCATVDELEAMVNLGFSWPLDPNAPPVDEFTENETDIPLKRPDTPKVG